jgi:hypothetical protein
VVESNTIEEQPHNMTRTLEQRVKAVEDRLAAMETQPASKQASKPWLKHSGWAANDRLYDRAAKHGLSYRKSS